VDLRDAEIGAGADRRRASAPAASALAASLEHEIEQCCLLVQRGAEALYSAEGRKQVRELIDHYMGNAKVLRDAAGDAGLEAFGGVNAPYIWVKTPTWPNKLATVRPDVAGAERRHYTGRGFRAQGEGYFRISAFNSRENAEEVARRLKRYERLRVLRSASPGVRQVQFAGRHFNLCSHM
jgi:aspartate/methionine/tyrosine aminotransferase